MYRLRDGALTQLTRDHSLYEEMRAIGMSLPSKDRFPHANVITRALGMPSAKLPDVAVMPWRAGDVFVLCTDGLTEGVTEARIAELLGSMAPGAACEALVREAYDNGARDNVTAVVLRVA